MSIHISTRTYEFAHGKKPKGRGCWAFIQPAERGQPERTMFAPALLTYSEACAWARQTLRREGWQDADLQAGS